MEMIPVGSSHLEAIGYDPYNATLIIAFQDGSEYEYSDVPQYRRYQILSGFCFTIFRFINPRGHL